MIKKTLIKLLILFFVVVSLVCIAIDSKNQNNDSVSVNTAEVQSESQEKNSIENKEEDGDSQLPTAKSLVDGIEGNIVLGQAVTISEIEPMNIQIIKLNDDSFVVFYTRIIKATSEFEDNRSENVAKVGIIKENTIEFGPEITGVWSNRFMILNDKKILLLSKIVGNRAKRIQIGRISGNVISFGEEQIVLGERDLGDDSIAMYPIDENHFILIYARLRHHPSIPMGGFAVIGTIVGDTVSFSQEYKYATKGEHGDTLRVASQKIIPLSENNFLISWGDTSVPTTISDGTISFGKRMNIKNPVPTPQIQGYNFVQLGKEEIRFGSYNNGDIIYTSKKDVDLGSFSFSNIFPLNENDFMSFNYKGGQGNRGQVSSETTTIIRMGTIKKDVISFYPDTISIEYEISPMFSLRNNRFLALLKKENKIIIGSLNDYINENQ